jgi:hypothetical protein
MTGCRSIFGKYINGTPPRSTYTYRLLPGIYLESWNRITIVSPSDKLVMTSHSLKLMQLKSVEKLYSGCRLSTFSRDRMISSANDKKGPETGCCSATTSTAGYPVRVKLYGVTESVRPVLKTFQCFGYTDR